eukprot:507801_1
MAITQIFTLCSLLNRQHHHQQSQTFIHAPRDNVAMTMRCKANEDCQVDCIDKQACEDATIEAPINGNLSINCNGQESCRRLTIHAPTNGVLNLECTGSSSCYQTVVDATNMILGSVHIQPISGSNLISGSTINCPPARNQCKITCINANSCQSMNIHTANDSKLLITSSGTSALQSSKVYCAGNSSYAIIASGTASGMLSHLIIYSAYGLSHPLLQLQCNYATNVSNCYSQSSPPFMACGSGYGVVSQIHLNAGTDDWRHVYNENEADMCNGRMEGWYGTHFDHDISETQIAYFVLMVWIVWFDVEIINVCRQRFTDQQLAIYL